MLKKIALTVLALCCIAASRPAKAQSSSLPACQWPPYENTVRQWGEVIDVAILKDSGGAVMASYFTLKGYAENLSGITFNCGSNPSSKGCEQLSIGDSILVSGRAEGQTDQLGNIVIPNVIFRCAGHVPDTCVKITPCI